jgi:RNA polymerase sigma factor (sigma-70 family)
MAIDKQSILSQLIMLRWKRGDPEAFQELVKNWERPLLYYIRRLLGEDRDEWDVLQEIWIRVYRGLDSLKDPDRLTVWLYKIAHNTVMRSLREKYKEPPIEHSADPSADELLMSETTDFTSDDAELLHRALGRLPIPFREVLTLHFLEQMSVQQISEVLEVPAGTVKSRLYHAKRSLKQAYESEFHQ